MTPLETSLEQAGLKATGAGVQLSVYGPHWLHDSPLLEDFTLDEADIVGAGMFGARALAGEMPAYTQGLMDIGAMLCRARRPSCESCPVAMHCVAYQTGKPEAFPVRSRKLPKKTETLWLLWVTRPDGSTWVERRPAVGIWSGLFCLPAFSSLESLEAVISSARLMCPETLPAVSHALTHKNLVLLPVRVSTTPSALTPGCLLYTSDAADE